MRTKRAISTVDGLRALLGGAVLAATVALLISVFVGRGFTIDGGSMAPGLLGPHANLECSSCGVSFAVGIEDEATLERPAACPNCGGQVERDPAAIAGGDSVVVDRRAFQFRAPRRYEVASLLEPNKASQLCVKRVVGLPGERVAIRGGDVFIDGQISRKSLAEQQAVALTVYDNSFQATDVSASPARWRSEGTASRWRAAGGGFSAGADDRPPRSADDWLVYHHLVRVGDSAEFVESPVLDTQAYNQTRPIVDPHVVSDLALAMDVQAEEPGKILLCAANLLSDDNRRFVPLRAGDGDFRNSSKVYCTLDVATGVWELRGPQRTLASGEAWPLADGRTHSLYFSLFDRQALLAVDGQVVFAHALDEMAEQSTAPTPDDNEAEAARPQPLPPKTSASRPFAIASNCAALRITALRIERDVYYTPVGAGFDGSADGAETQLADDEFFVLSDNSRLGFDSRYPGFGPAVSFNLFVGKPLAAYSRNPRAPGWWGGIQVPALWRIRYIR